MQGVITAGDTELGNGTCHLPRLLQNAARGVEGGHGTTRLWGQGHSTDVAPPESPLGCHWLGTSLSPGSMTCVSPGSVASQGHHVLFFLA